MLVQHSNKKFWRHFCAYMTYRYTHPSHVSSVPRDYVRGALLPSGKTDHGVSDAFRNGLKEYLPRLGHLVSEGYTFEPSPTQLEAMHRIDPNSIKGVCGQMQGAKGGESTGIVFQGAIMP